MNKQDKREIEASLGLLQDERYRVEFYNHEVVDTEKTYDAAIKKVTQDALLKTESKQKFWQGEITKANNMGLPSQHLVEKLADCEVLPDYSADNLKRHGAVQVMKKVPYIKIQRIGSKDFNSQPVTDIHKQKYPEQWATFEANNGNIREERHNLRTETSGQQDNSQGSNWHSGGVSYTPTPYTISFG